VILNYLSFELLSLQPQISFIFLENHYDWFNDQKRLVLT